MSESNALAPAVQSILAAARDRTHDTERLSVAPRSLPTALESAERDGRTPVVAEVKPTSPSTSGGRRDDSETRIDDPATAAREMVAGGAAAVSVLTEPEHFGGSLAALRAVRDAVDVPVLRKDFLLEEGHLDAVEADVVLLIARFLGDDLEPMLEAARDRGFRALVEVHDGDELARAVDAGATLVGVNNRDLAELTVDLDTFESVAPAVPEDVTLVAESGIGSPADVRRMREAGADGLLVGNAVVDGGQGSVRANTRRLVEA
ncbi:indole-3-glycerol phosphate synthase [Halobacterium zhouii]|uniref:indole-3-glycerol phosphate synthase n=1 Tax=Halobacterium zhouii TaxID=2902624 RepID=UPI001E2DD7F1|nr:indole-3-glycerol phosphate synthase [Halobacterium zhouii]